MTDGTHDRGGKNWQRNGTRGWFPHERLDVFQAAIEFADWVERAREHIPRARLRNQLEEAAESIVLNICEAAARSAGSRRNQFEIAYGSAAECHGALMLCKLRGVPNTEHALDTLDRIRRMLARLK